MKGMLSCSNLLKIVHSQLLTIKESQRRIRPIALADALMSGFAIFSLKYSSLLQFDKHAAEKAVSHNLRTVYQIKKVPSDTQMRERLDDVSPHLLRKVFKRLFSQCQRSKKLEHFRFYDNRYLMRLDGTGYFYSKKVHCEHCCEKKHRDGSIGYYHQMLSGAIVHPDEKVVLPFVPEAIMKSDGSTKNDCERNSATRFLAHLKREHPHLRLTVT